MDKLRHAGPHSLSDTELISLFASPRFFDKIREQLCQYQGVRGLIDNARDTSLGKALTGRLEAALELSRRYLEAELRARPVLSNIDTDTINPTNFCRAMNRQTRLSEKAQNELVMNSIISPPDLNTPVSIH